MNYLATVTSKNQLTIPKEVVDKLNLEEIRKVLILVQDKQLVIRPLASKVEALAGSLSYLAAKKPADLKKIRSIVQRRIAKQIAREGI